MFDEVVGRELAAHPPEGEALDAIWRSDGMFVLSDGENGVGCANPVDLEVVR